MKIKIARWILKCFKKWGWLRFETTKSNHRFEIYTEIYFLDEWIATEIWNGNELITHDYVSRQYKDGMHGW